MQSEYMLWGFEGLLRSLKADKAKFLSLEGRHELDLQVGFFRSYAYLSIIEAELLVAIIFKIKWIPHLERLIIKLNLQKVLIRFRKPQIWVVCFGTLIYLVPFIHKSSSAIIVWRTNVINLFAPNVFRNICWCTKSMVIQI